MVFLLRNSRQLEIHQPVVTDVGQQICSAVDRQFHRSRSGIGANYIATVSGRRIEKVQNRLPDFDSPVGIGNQIHARGTVLEHTSFKNLSLWSCLAPNTFPLRRTSEECFHSICGSPIEIVFGILSIAEFCWDRNDSLMLIVGQGHKDMHGS